MKEGIPMGAPVAGFLKVSTPDGRTFYINPHHVTAVEAAGAGLSVHLHSGERISLAENAEEFLQLLHDLHGTPGRHLRQRVRERRQRGRSA
jgi:uncharacterized protein YlzI (FlbEa/FlbD family)